MKNKTKTLLLMAAYVAVLARYIQSAFSFVLSYFGASWMVIGMATLLSIALAYIATELVVRRWKTSLLTKTVVLCLLQRQPGYWRYYSKECVKYHISSA